MNKYKKNSFLLNSFLIQLSDFCGNNRTNPINTGFSVPVFPTRFVRPTVLQCKQQRKRSYILVHNAKNFEKQNFFEKSFYTSYTKLTEIKLITIGLASPERIRRWAEKTLPNGKVIGQVTNANTLHHKTFKPQKGGLFCERIFGPLKDFECACGKTQKPFSVLSHQINPTKEKFSDAPLESSAMHVSLNKKGENPPPSILSSSLENLTNDQTISNAFLPSHLVNQGAGSQNQAKGETEQGQEEHQKESSSNRLRAVATLTPKEDGEGPLAYGLVPFAFVGNQDKKQPISQGKTLSNFSKRKYCPICDVEYTWSIIRRYQLGYIDLVSPVTHVWYLKATPSYLSILLDMKKKHLEQIVYCSETMTLENSVKFFSFYQASQKNNEQEKRDKPRLLASHTHSTALCLGWEPTKARSVAFQEQLWDPSTYPLSFAWFAPSLAWEGNQPKQVTTLLAQQSLTLPNQSKPVTTLLLTQQPSEKWVGVQDRRKQRGWESQIEMKKLNWATKLAFYKVPQSLCSLQRLTSVSGKALVQAKLVHRSYFCLSLFTKNQSNKKIRATSIFLGKFLKVKKNTLILNHFKKSLKFRSFKLLKCFALLNSLNSNQASLTKSEFKSASKVNKLNSQSKFKSAPHFSNRMRSTFKFAKQILYFSCAFRCEFSLKNYNLPNREPSLNFSWKVYSLLRLIFLLVNFFQQTFTITTKEKELFTSNNTNQLRLRQRRLSAAPIKPMAWKEQQSAGPVNKNLKTRSSFADSLATLKVKLPYGRLWGSAAALAIINFKQSLNVNSNVTKARSTKRTLAEKANREKKTYLLTNSKFNKIIEEQISSNTFNKKTIDGETMIEDFLISLDKEKKKSVEIGIQKILKKLPIQFYILSSIERITQKKAILMASQKAWTVLFKKAYKQASLKSATIFKKISNNSVNLTYPCLSFPHYTSFSLALVGLAWVPSNNLQTQRMRRSLLITNKFSRLLKQNLGFKRVKRLIFFAKINFKNHLRTYISLLINLFSFSYQSIPLTGFSLIKGQLRSPFTKASITLPNPSKQKRGASKGKEQIVAANISLSSLVLSDITIDIATQLTIEKYARKMIKGTEGIIKLLVKSLTRATILASFAWQRSRPSNKLFPLKAKKSTFSPEGMTSCSFFCNARTRIPKKKVAPWSAALPTSRDSLMGFLKKNTFCKIPPLTTTLLHPWPIKLTKQRARETEQPITNPKSIGYALHGTSLRVKLNYMENQILQKSFFLTQLSAAKKQTITCSPFSEIKKKQFLSTSNEPSLPPFPAVALKQSWQSKGMDGATDTKEAKIVNNIYTLSHRFRWEHEVDWTDFLEYISAPINFCDKAIPKYATNISFANSFIPQDIGSADKARGPIKNSPKPKIQLTFISPIANGYTVSHSFSDLLVSFHNKKKLANTNKIFSNEVTQKVASAKLSFGTQAEDQRSLPLSLQSIGRSPRSVNLYREGKLGFIKQRLKNVSFSGGGLIQKLLTELNLNSKNELNKMDKQNRILLYELNKQIYKFKISLEKQVWQNQKGFSNKLAFIKNYQAKLDGNKAKLNKSPNDALLPSKGSQTKPTYQKKALFPLTSLISESLPLLGLQAYPTNQSKKNGPNQAEQSNNQGEQEHQLKEYKNRGLEKKDIETFYSGSDKSIKHAKKRIKELIKQRDLLTRRTKLVRKLFISSKTAQSPSSMILSLLPVLPPDLRPIVKMGNSVGGGVKIAASDLNRLYQRVIYRNERLKKFLKDSPLLPVGTSFSNRTTISVTTLSGGENGPIKKEIKAPSSSYKKIEPKEFNNNNNNNNKDSMHKKLFKIPTNLPTISLTTESSTELKFTQGLLQEAVDNLIQNNKSGVPAEKDSRGRALKSLSDILKGKQGRFRQYLLGKRVDYSGRSVIIVGPKLKIHQCGIPKEMALELFLPFLLKRILNYNLARTVVGAKSLINNNKALVWELLTEIMQVCPVLLNRAPTLHRLGIQAFIPKLVDGRAILLHPLVCSAFNADFDGDQMAVHIPITVESRAEAWKLMLSRNNLLSPATGDPISVPSQDMVLGCYYLTTQLALSKGGAKDTTKKKRGFGLYFKNQEDVLKIYNQQKIDLHANVWIQWNGLIEDTHELEYPIEIRITKNGTWKEINPKSHRNFDQKGILINHYLKTTPGKIHFNALIKNAINCTVF
nr:RNA polymerase beta' subunit [Chloromonas rosae]